MAKDTQLLNIFQEVMKDINESGQSDILKGSLKSIKELQKVIQAQDELIEKTLSAGDERAAMRVLKAAKQAQQAQVEATNNLKEAREKLATLDQEQNAKAYQAQLKIVSDINQEINRLAKESKQMQKNATEFSRGMDYSMTQYETLLKTREERINQIGKAGALIEEKFSNRFEASVSSFTSGINDLENFGSLFTTGLKSLGDFLQERQGKAAEKAAQGKSGTGLANMLGSLSKVAGTLAVVGGSVMALVKLFQFVEGTVIEANKKLVEGGFALNDLWVTGTSNTNKGFERIRDTFRDADFANEMGIALDETLDLVTGFNNLNLTIKKFGGGVEGMERMKESMKAAKGFSLGLGISMDEAQEYMTKFTEQLGVSVQDGSHLSRMASDFASIRDMALQSSYSTGNFFKRVSELTGELDNMNSRTSEAGALLIRFGKAIGKSGLDKALQSLVTGFRGEGYLDQLKRNMLSRTKGVEKAIKSETIRFGRNLEKTYGGGSAGGGKALDFLYQKAGVKDMQGLQKKLAGLDAKGQQKLMATLSGKDATKAGITGEFKDELYKFMRLARGTRKNATAADKQAAQEEMGALGNLKTRFAILEKVVGNQDINNLSVIAKESLGRFGIGKEQLEEFAKLQTTMKGTMTAAMSIAKQGRRAKKSDEEILKEIKSKYGDIGVSVKNGKLVDKDTGMLIENFSDYLSAQGSKIDELLPPIEHQKSQEQFLSEGVEATTSVFDVLKNNIAGILNDMSKGIYNLLSWFTKGGDEDEIKAKNEAIKQVEDRLTVLSKERAAEQDAIREEKKRLHNLSFQKGKMTKAEKTKYKTDVAALKLREKELEELKARESRSKEQLRLIQKTEYDRAFNDYDTAEILKESGQKTTTRRRKLGTEKGRLGEAQEAEKALLAPIADIIGGDTYKHLSDYLKGGGDDKRVRQYMAKKSINFKKDTDTYSVGARGGGVDFVTELFSSLTQGGKTLYSSKDRSKRGKTQTVSEGGTVLELEAKTIEELNKPLSKAQRDKVSTEDAKAREKENIKQQKEAFIQAQDQLKKTELENIAKALGIKDSSTTAIMQAYESADKSKKAKVSALGLGGNKAAQILLGDLAVGGSGGGGGDSLSYEAGLAQDLADAEIDYGKDSPEYKKALADYNKGIAEKKKELVEFNNNLDEEQIRQFSETEKEDLEPTQDILLSNRGGNRPPKAYKLNTKDQISSIAGGLAFSKPGGAIDQYINQRMGNMGGMNLTFNIDGSKTPEATGREVLRRIKESNERYMGGVR